MTQLSRVTTHLGCLLMSSAFAAGAGGQPAGDDRTHVDKSGFNLFHPTPSQYLRELSTDGPGATESASTVDAGHFQAELTLVSYSADRDSAGGVARRREAWSVAPLLLKVGLLNQLDAQIALEPYQLVHERADGRSLTRRGFGDTTVRLKYNLWGNEGGPTAFAAMPYVKFPTAGADLGNGAIEGGLILPLEATLPGEFYAGLTTRFDAVRDEDRRGYHPEFINSLAFGHELCAGLFAYVELFTAVSTERGAAWVGTFDTGLIYSLTKNIQLNAGVNIGMTRSAEDWSPFVGLAWRF